MSSSGTAVSVAISGVVASFKYPPTHAAATEIGKEVTEETRSEPEVTLTEKSLMDRLAAERTVGYANAEAALRQEFERNADLHLTKISQAIVSFDSKQKAYFARVEAEVVQLALAIAGKILHREAQVDPMLVAAIVHLALGQLREGSSASMRVRPEEASKWRDYIPTQATTLAVKIIEDGELECGDCVLETELGTVNFSLDAQLKEVERGFFDVLAQKPKV